MVTCHFSRSWRCWPRGINEEVGHPAPLEILTELGAIELEILEGIEELEEMLR